MKKFVTINNVNFHISKSSFEDVRKVFPKITAAEYSKSFEQPKKETTVEFVKQQTVYQLPEEKSEIKSYYPKKRSKNK